MDSTDAHERLAVVETKVSHLEETLEGIQKTLEELKPIVWKAAGVAVGVLAVVELLIKATH